MLHNSVRAKPAESKKYNKTTAARDYACDL